LFRPIVAKSGARAPRQNRDFIEAIQAAPPVRPFGQKYFAFSESKTVLIVRHPAPTRGAFRDRHER
jgi:hypothetical protein